MSQRICFWNTNHNFFDGIDYNQYKRDIKNYGYYRKLFYIFGNRITKFNMYRENYKTEIDKLIFERFV
jgi:hypothetical protein